MSEDSQNDRAGAVAIVGGGSIGIAFAIVFARAGRPVKLYEPDASRRGAVPGLLRARLDDLRAYELLDEAADIVSGRVTVVADLAAAVRDAVYVQECAPEDLV